MPRRRRPYATTAIVLWVIGALLIVPPLLQLASGSAGAQGFAPVGISIGVLLGIAGTLLFFTGPKKPLDDPRDEPVDD
ncbi:hypothetical protein Q9R19_08460 [Microbacterium sp. ARD32]|uniref:hypothetical protein n=1 Tax=Microbacterium sp. ARD32 TaxID=2962577 RepID=UPI0028815C65|nr:hypothetical protein [Microbacterium sp. ARD32]MDT0157652.1 hypothetical protein [Microbacterium sp. ARD32]